MLVLLFGAGLAGAAGTAKVVLVSRCGGVNAEVEQAVDGRYVYEAWIGCLGIGFARSTDGGRTFGATKHVPDKGHLWDPAVAVAPDGTVYVAYMIGSRLATGEAEMTPAVAVSVNHGRSFARVSHLPVATPRTRPATGATATSSQSGRTERSTSRGTTDRAPPKCPCSATRAAAARSPAEISTQ